ncbi:hypothetical protein [Streptomyces sp. NPDC002952]|uniref:hypothetical protein n=1 Tax=Streptomyces sp. NPDC002952 TaxID=3364673 RepID=UPI0036C4445F
MRITAVALLVVAWGSSGAILWLILQQLRGHTPDKTTLTSAWLALGSIFYLLRRLEEPILVIPLRPPGSVRYTPHIKRPSITLLIGTILILMAGASLVSVTVVCILAAALAVVLALYVTTALFSFLSSDSERRNAAITVLKVLNDTDQPATPPAADPPAPDGTTGAAP